MKQILILLIGITSFNHVFAIKQVDLILPRLKDTKHLNYFVNLLNQSLKLIDHGHIKARISTNEMTQKRSIFAFTNNEEINIIHMIQTADRDKKYTGINIDLTNNIFGHRILLIPQYTAASFGKVKTLKEFRALNKIGIFGSDWYDAKVWQYNKLPYAEVDGDWRTSIFPMLSSKKRGVDYFSRSITEILSEAKDNPNLEIEPNLLFIYDRDTHFYLNHSSKRYKAIIERALKKAQQIGLIHKLVEDEWSAEFKKLNLDQRIKIRLQTDFFDNNHPKH